MGEPAVSPTYCPINGAYSFAYSVNDGTENMSECSSHTSEIADCPYGFGFNLNFRGCSFGNLGEKALIEAAFSHLLYRDNENALPRPPDPRCHPAPPPSSFR